MNQEYYNVDYYENGLSTGKSCYQNYTWMPEMTIPMAMTMIDYLSISKNHTILDYGCFTAGTKILVDGYKQKNIENIIEGDNVITNQNNVKKVISISKRNVDETISILLPYKMSIETTNEHPFLCQSKESVICKKDKPHSCNTNNKGFCSKCGTKPPYDPIYKKASELKEGDFLCIPRLIKNNTDNKEDWAELLGFYLAEGNVLYSHRPHIGGIEFNFNIKEIDYIERVDFLAKKLGATSTTIYMREEHNVGTIQIFGKKISTELVRLGGKLADGKFLHREILETWNVQSLRKLILSWLKGDGCIQTNMNKGSFTWLGTSISYPLILGMRQLLFKLGIMNTIYKHKIREKRRQSYSLGIIGKYNIDLLNETPLRTMNTSIQSRRTEKYIFVPIRKICINKKQNVVYNMEVEDDHNYIANDMVVHNCSKGYLVKAFRLLHRKAWGVDISDYALSQVPNDVKEFCSPVNLLDKREFDFCIAKDVFEHIEPNVLSTVLHCIKAKEMLVIVPLGSNGQYFASANNFDKSHIICEDDLWWVDFFTTNNWDLIEISYKIEGIKDNYSVIPKAHGFFRLLNKSM